MCRSIPELQLRGKNRGALPGETFKEGILPLQAPLEAAKRGSLIRCLRSCTRTVTQSFTQT
jgi:hypothetical protein